MADSFIGGRSIKEWLADDVLLQQVVALNEVCWFNSDTLPFAQAMPSVPLNGNSVADAAERLERFRPYIAKVFPETAHAAGLIESPLLAVPEFHHALARYHGSALSGRLLAKLDSHLPISGSIKARGGIYEVLKHAEGLALEAGILSLGDNYSKLDDRVCRDFFSTRGIVVGSTGNLGLSIGIMGAQLGFHVTVHMSADARQWKKDLLRSKGVTVVEHATDYSLAVAEGRRQAESDPACHFVDDEHSLDLFLGYAVAAGRLSGQLDAMGVTVDEAHPLFVYLPCGVGGGPGGVAFGLKQVYGDAVHCFFAEPVHSPAMLLGLHTGLHDAVSVQDFGIDNITAADGLAVGRASGLVGKMMQHLVDGVYTVSDDNLFRYLALMAEHEGVQLEPSALAGAAGIARVANAHAWLASQGLAQTMKNATHLMWCTGGSMVPDDEMRSYHARGLQLLAF